jgi:hypothetical protein
MTGPHAVEIASRLSQATRRHLIEASGNEPQASRHRALADASVDSTEARCAKVKRIV